MNIRKHWKNILLTTTAFFWAGCNGDSVTEPNFHINSSNSNVESSESKISESSSSETTTASSSSESNASSFSKGDPTSSNSAEVTCEPGDSTISYYPASFSAEVAKRSAEEQAQRTGIAQIDSLKKNFHAVSRCINDLRQELSRFIALYGAPTVFPKDEVCSDGTTRQTKEYLDYLQLKEEWEKNKPALDEECQKIYDEKLKEIEKKIDNCFPDPN